MAIADGLIDKKIENDFSDFVCIWIKTKSKEFTVEEETDIEKLQEHLPSMEVSDDLDECCNYILSKPHDLIFLRLGHGLSYLVELFKGINQIKCFYPSETSDHDFNKKVRGVFLDIDELYGYWSKDMLSFENSLTYLTPSESRTMRLEKSTSNMTEVPKNISWFQTLLKLLMTVLTPTRDNLENILIQARRLYSSNKIMLDSIADFKTSYKPEEAVQWYTRGSFIFGVVNKALRTENIVIIYQFRLLLRDIYQQLTKLQRQQESSLLNIKLYRGQRIAPDELEQLQKNVGGLVSLNTFTSTSKDPDVAKAFSGYDAHDKLFKSVIFVYVMDGSIKLSDVPPFADITHVSHFAAEEEILLSPGTVFRIKSCNLYKDFDSVYEFHLYLEKYEDPMLSELQSDFLQVMAEPNLEEGSFVLRLLPIIARLNKRDQIRPLVESVPKTSNPQFELLRSRFAQYDKIKDDSPASKMKNLIEFFGNIKETNNIWAAVQPTMNSYCAYLDNLISSTSTDEQQELNMDEIYDEFFGIFKQLFVPSESSSTTERSYSALLENGCVSRFSRRRDKTRWNAEEPVDHQTLFEDKIALINNLAREAQQAVDDGDPTRAIDLCNKALTLSDNDEISADILQAISDLFAMQKRWPEILRCSEQLLKLSGLPGNSLKRVDAIRRAAFAAFSMGFYDKALNISKVAYYFYQQHHSPGYPAENELLSEIACYMDACKEEHQNTPAPSFED